MGGGSTGSTQVRIEQQYVGWVVGGRGAVVKEIEMHTGCKISLNQDTKDMGYSVATLTGDSQQISRGYESITEKVRQANPSAAAPAIIGGTAPQRSGPPGISAAQPV